MKFFSAIIKYSLANRFLILAASVMLTFLGLHSAKELPVDVLPKLDKTVAAIVVEAAGTAPEEIEASIALPLENALAGMTGLKRLRTSISASLCVINIDFDWDIEPMSVRQLIQERIQALNLPDGITPIIAPLSSVMGEIMMLALTCDNTEISPIDLRTMADYKVARRISNISGVSQVLCTGGGLKQYRIIPDTRKMEAYDISFEELENAVCNAQSNSGGGISSSKGTELSIRGVGRSTDLNDIKNAVVKKSQGIPVTIENIAEVKIDKAQLRGDAAFNNNPAVILTVQKSPNADTLTLCKEVENAINSINKTLPKGVKLISIYSQSSFISHAVDNVRDAITDGAIMVIIILFLFLMNARTTLITLTAIPLSLAITAIYFRYTGASINTMTLGGIAVAIGMIVDDAIVDVENVFRRLSENSRLKKPRNRAAVILDACVEIRASIFYATATIVMVFIPTLALGGMEGKMFKPLAEAVIVSMTASFFVALTLIPALCSLLMKGKSSERGEAFFSKTVKKLFEYFIVRPSVKFPFITLFLVGIFSCVAFALYPTMKSDFMPQLNEDSTLLIVQLSADSSLERSNEIADIITKRLKEIPNVKMAPRKIGRAEKDDHAEPVNTIKFIISFNDISGKARIDTIEEIRKAMENIAGTSSVMGPPIAHRIDYMLSGIQAQMAVKIYGQDLEKLRDLANTLAQEIKKLKGTQDVNVEKQSLTKQIKISVDRKKAKLYGVQIGEINKIIESVLGGVSVAQVLDGDEIFDIAIRLDETKTAQLHNLQDLRVENLNGQKFPLSAFAKIEYGTGENQINRENQSRRISVYLNIADGNSVELASKIQNLIDALNLPSGYYAKIEGQFQNRIDAGRNIAVLFIFAMLGIIALLYTHFRNTSTVVQILATLPLAFAGGIAFSKYFVDTVSVASLIGMIALAGIASRNTIMLISHYGHLMKNEGESFDDKMIIRGTLERLNPILMTALTAAFALIPLMFDPLSAGRELLYPVAVMIVGGLISSTILSMAVTPALFKLMGNPPDKD